MNKSVDCSSCHALVVDDETAMLDVVAGVLEPLGMTIHRAKSGEHALEVFAEQVIDIVLTDIRMDSMTGFELMKRLQLMDPTVKVIVMTGYDTYEMVRRALSAGAYDYLDKPLDDHEVIANCAIRAYESGKLLRENALLVERLTETNGRLEVANQRLVALNRKLRVLAITDGLTGLFNRRHVDQTLARETLRRNRYQDPLSILLVDVDNFKRFNDEYGHDGGDQALQMVANRLRFCARNTDIVGRYGGEEFIVILPRTEPANAAILAERLRADIAARSLELNVAVTNLTVSVGVAGVTGEHGPIDGRDLILAADQALYAAKAGGRNRIERTIEIGPEPSFDTAAQLLHQREAG